MKKFDIYELVCENYNSLTKEELKELLKETAFKLWEALDTNNERYFEISKDIIENTDEALFDLID